MATRYYIKDLEYELRIDDLNYDPWGTVMACFFALAGELYHRYPDCEILQEWEYSPGLSPRDTDSHWFDIFEQVHTGDLIAFGRILNRYSNLLRIAGKDY